MLVLKEQPVIDPIARGGGGNACPFERVDAVVMKDSAATVVAGGVANIVPAFDAIKTLEGGANQSMDLFVSSGVASM